MRRRLATLLLLAAAAALAAVASAADEATVAPKQQVAAPGPPAACSGARANDAVLGQSPLFGNRNTSDSLWHDQLPYFRRFGPISRLTMYKAHFYDGLWHDPGELKGLQLWYGPQQQPPIYAYADGDANLMGARKPHLPETWNLTDGELLTRAEFQWDPISMRFVSFTTNRGRTLSWGFPDVTNATTAVASAPVPGAYIAAVRGFEGKPAPVSKKRYIIQPSVVWALPSCRPEGQAPGAAPAAVAAQLAAGAGRQAASVYAVDAETAALVPQGVEGANIIYQGVSVKAPPPGAPAAAAPTATAPPAAAAAAAKQQGPQAQPKQAGVVAPARAEQGQQQQQQPQKQTPPPPATKNGATGAANPVGSLVAAAARALRR